MEEIMEVLVVVVAVAAVKQHLLIQMKNDQ